MDLTVVKERMKNVTPPIESGHGLKIFKPYDKNRFYVLGADCAEGVGGDYSVATLFDARSREQVAILRGHLKPKQFAEDIAALCKRYTSGDRMPPLVAVERNNHGHAVLLELNHHIYYRNLFHRENDDQPGWVTDKVTRPIMIDTFIDAVDHGSVLIHDLDTLGECLTLVNEQGKIQAASGKHDDCIIASALALQMCIESSIADIYENIEQRIRV